MIVWMSLIIGQPFAILMYYHDYYVLHSQQSWLLSAVLWTSSAVCPLHQLGMLVYHRNLVKYVLHLLQNMLKNVKKLSKYALIYAA